MIWVCPVPTDWTRSRPDGAGRAGGGRERRASGHAHGKGMNILVGLKQTLFEVVPLLTREFRTLLSPS